MSWSIDITDRVNWYQSEKEFKREIELCELGLEEIMEEQEDNAYELSREEE